MPQRKKVRLKESQKLLRAQGSVGAGQSNCSRLVFMEPEWTESVMT